MDDYVLLPRATLSDDLWRNPYAARLYFYFLKKADENGIWTVSFKEIQRDVKLSRQQYRTALEWLKTTALISTSSTTSSTTITFSITANKHKIKITSSTTPTTTLSTTKKQIRFTPPTEEEVATYVAEKGYHFNPAQFVPHYQSKGWKVGNQPMKDWHAACRTWEISWKEKYGERFYYEIQPIASTDTPAARKASRDRLHRLATGVVSQSADKLLSLYDGVYSDPDTRAD